MKHIPSRKSASRPLPGREVYIVDGSRTPFLKARQQAGPFSAADLAVGTVRLLLARQNFLPTAIDEVICGCTMPSPDEMNIARIIALRVGCGNDVPAFTVHRNCASGMQALDNAAQDIASGRADLILAGGTEAMSRAPLLFNQAMANWVGQWYATKTVGGRVQLLTKLRLNYFVPIIALLKGLTDPVVGLNMGQTAEKLAHRFNISRKEMDQFAAISHQRILATRKEGYLNEVTPLIDNRGKAYMVDDGARTDSTVEKLGTLKPAFDRKYGQVTAGNASQVTDGAAFLLLASKDAIKKYNLPILARIIDVEWAALDPSQMGLGPVFASTPLLTRHHFNLKDIDYWEINEAFAAQILSCLKAWQDETFCREDLNLSHALGTVSLDRLNVDGGAISLGHPVGASGARIVLHLANVLKEREAKRGIATLCIGGGQGGAMLIERVEKPL